MRIGLALSVAVAPALLGCVVRDSGGADDGTSDGGASDGGGSGGGGSDGGGTSGSETDGVAPPGCEELFDEGPFDCNDSLRESCDYLAQHSDLAVEWSIRLELDAGGAISDFERKVECITEYLDGSGVEHGPIDGDSFGVTATYAQIAPLCSASMIRDCGPWPLAETCAYLVEAACEQNPLCSSYRGMRVEAGADCVTHDAFAACNTGDCGDATVVLIDPAGTCWYLYVYCDVPEGWTESLGGTCPDWDVVETLPECEGA